MHRSCYLLLLSALLILPDHGLSADHPNILWITSEDNGPQIGCYGDKYAVTPSLDALAAKGMRYTNAISCAPVCAPARTTIISGIFPPSTGAEHMRSMVPYPAGLRMYPQHLKDAGYYCTNNSKEDYNLTKPGTVWDESSPKAHYQNRPAGSPFFTIFNSTISHESQIRNAINDKDRIHDPARAPIPAYHPDTPEVRKDWAQYYDRVTMMDTISGKQLAELEKAGLAEDTIVFYYGDHGSGMPRSKRWPYNSGLNVPLIVYFPEKWKHLAPQDYTPGGVCQRLVSFVDLAPTLLSLAGLEIPSTMQGKAFAGPQKTPDPKYVYGFRGRMDERYDLVRTVRGSRYIYLRQYMPHRIYGQHVDYMFQTPTTRVWETLFKEGKLNEAQSLFWKTKPSEELYDLETDPEEVHNLAGSPEHRMVLEEMRQAQQTWAREIKDVGFLPEDEIHTRSGEGSPYDMGHDPKRFDFEAVFAAANLATSQKSADLPAIVALLESPDSAVRYWGATGLLVHGPAGLESGRAALIKAADSDPSGSVRAVSAEVLGRYGNQDETARALEILVDLADQTKHSVPVALLAANAIDYLGDRARAAQDRILALPMKPAGKAERIDGYVGRVILTLREKAGVATPAQPAKAKRPKAK